MSTAAGIPGSLTSRGFGKRIGFGRRPALLVIDMIEAFTNPAINLGSALQPQIECINALLHRTKASGIRRYFSIISYDDGDFKDQDPWVLKNRAGMESLRAGTAGTRLDPALAVEPADIRLVKKFASCFFATNLAAQLRADAVDTLILTGCSTSGCVRATAVDAIQNGFRPVVVADAVGDRLQSAHDQTLIDLQARYADVVMLQEVLQYLDEFAPPARAQEY